MARILGGGDLPDTATRWRIDGEDRGTVPSAWLRAVEQVDTQRGQPSALQALLDAPRVDLLLPGGQTLSSVWVGADTLLWCRPAGCRSSTLSAEAAAGLLLPLKAPR